MKRVAALAALLTLTGGAALAETREVFLQDGDGTRLKIAQIEIAADQSYSVRMDDTAFSDHFLSMRPFKCIEGPKKHWCHVPYPYPIARDLSDDLTDLEYDFLFLWKGQGDYGINMWNGIYYVLDKADGKLVGRLHEMDMDILSAPPDPGNTRPVEAKHLEESDPDSHWLPQLVIE